MRRESNLFYLLLFNVANLSMFLCILLEGTIDGDYLLLQEIAE